MMKKNDEERDYQSLMKDALLELQAMRAKLNALERAKSEPVAIIGMSCRFPGGTDNPEAFWQLLHNGVDAITEIPSDRWNIDAYYDPNPDAPGKMYTRYGGFIEQLQNFDAQFFGISPREAISIDPQQRLLLEVSWNALENSGLVPAQLMGSQTGVFISICSYDYSQLLLNRASSKIDAYVGTGTAHSTASGRLSYFFGLKGPSLSVDTACSSSLVALHLACQSLRNSECDAALVGGVNRILSPEITINFSRSHMLAPDGRCKTFDAAADGFIRSEGCGVILLKRLSDALANHDTILALIRGTAVNHDGRTSGLTVPNGPSQQAVIRKALENAGVTPDQVSYVETHGAGTALGDPIEAAALGSVFGRDHERDYPLVIGSVKTNIGHLEAASGIAGLIKVVLSLQHEEIPSHLHFKQPSPYISWDELPFLVPTEPIPWPKNDKKRIAGVSAFGLSGTNTHVVLEEAPNIKQETSKIERPLHLLTFSGKDRESLSDLTRKYKEYLASTKEKIENICYTANVGRSHFEYRRAVIGESKKDFVKKLIYLINKDQTFRSDRNSQKKITFLFTGQGSQYPGMGRELYESAPEFRSALERCDVHFQEELGYSLLEFLYASEVPEEVLNQPIYAQPAIFSIEYALSELWQSYGVRPSLVLGHSIGEYAAACCVGLLPFADAVKLVAIRARVMQSVKEKGRMVGVLASEARVQALISDYRDSVSIAAVNSAENVTISGTQEAVAEVLQKIKSARIFVEPLPISHAFHSVVMEPYIENFREELPGITSHKPVIPIISTLTGKFVDGEMGESAYWSRHLCQKVRFYGALQLAAARGYRWFVEIGGTATLTGLAAQVISDDEALFLPSLRKGTPAWQQLLTSLAELYLHGGEIDWEQFNKSYTKKKVILPNYPFQRKRYWIEEDRKNYYDMMHELQWEEKPLDLVGIPSDRRTKAYIIFTDQHGIGGKLAQHLTQSGSSCFQIKKSADLSIFQIAQSNIYSVDPCSKEALRTLFHSLQLDDTFSAVTILYLWGLDTVNPAKLTTDILHREQQVICTGLLHLVQIMAESRVLNKVKLCVLTKNAVNTPIKGLSVSQSTLWGLGRVISTEYAEFWDKLLDVDDETLTYHPERILEELDSGDEDQVSLRDGKTRYVLRLKKMKKSDFKRDKYILRDDRTYLITGGLGGLGLLTTEWMVKNGAQHIVLIGRKGPKVSAQQTIEKLKNDHRVNIVVMQGDVSKTEDVANVVGTINRTMPPLAGIIHAAGVVDVGVIAEQSWERFENVFASKVDGSWNLHKIVEKLPLDFFIMFSSTASTGNMGESNYAAANMFLNALASYRRNNNLPALSICWQPWANIGMSAFHEEIDIDKRVAAEGFYSTTPEDGIKLLELLFSPHDTEPYILDVDWKRYTEYLSFKHRKGMFYNFCKPYLSSKDSKQDKLLQELKVVHPERRYKILVAALQEFTAEVMGHKEQEKIEVDKSLREQGLDSLMSVQLRNYLTNITGSELSATLFFNYPTIEQAVAYLLENVLTFEEEEQHEDEEFTPQTLQDFENLLKRIDEGELLTI